MSKKKWWEIIAILIVFGVVGFFYFRDLHKHPLHSDEHEWVRRGILFSEMFFFDADYTNPMWFRFESMDMPKLGQYLYGIWLRVFYGEEMSGLMEKTNFNSDWKREDGYGLLWHDKYWWVNGAQQSIADNFQAFSIIVSARYMSVFFTLLGLILFYRLISEFMGVSGGLMAIILLASNSVFYEVTRQSLLDGPLFLGIMMAFIGMDLLTKKTANWRQETGLLLVSSLLFGVGALIKLNGLLLLLVGFMTMLFLEICGFQKIRMIRFKILMLRYLIVLCGLFVLFWASDPLWWQNPGKAAVLMLETRVRLTQSQSRAGWAEPLTSFNLRFSYPIKTYLNASLFGKSHFYLDPGEIFLMAIGLGGLFLDKKMYKNSIGIIFLVGSIFWFFVVMNYLSVGASRHAIVLMPFLALFEASGLLMIWRMFLRVIREPAFRYKAKS